MNDLRFGDKASHSLRLRRNIQHSNLLISYFRKALKKVDICQHGFAFLNV